VPRSVISLFLLFSLGACGDEGSNTAANASPPPPLVVITPIPEVQGSGDASPIDGQDVTVVGVVTGDFQDQDADNSRNLGGFFLQAETPDGDPDTSDGVFVYDGRSPALDISVGQLVQVTGTVFERFGETQITASTVVVNGTGTIQVADLVLPAHTRLNSQGQVIADLERFEGMLVGLTEPAFVSGVFNLARYGEITLSQGGRLQQFTNSNAPDIDGFADHQTRNASRTLILDDGLSGQNPDSYRYLYTKTSDSEDHPLRVGDTVVTASGNIRYSRGSGGSGTEAYRLEPTEDPQFEAKNLRNAKPPDTGGSVTVASFNVLNYFTTIDNGQRICGPSGGMNCRGANSDDEFDRQHAKTINTLLALDADIVGLMELENNGDVSLQSIVDGLNAESGAGTWDFIATGHIGTDAITVGLIYKPTVVQPAGVLAILNSSIDSRFNDRKSRPALAQTFDVTESGGRFTVAVNHLKSKGSDCDDVGDPNLNDGQGNCNLTRTNAAMALGNWLNADPTRSGDPDFLIIGDLNAYLREDPIVALENAGFVNLLETADGSEAYSYVFAAQAGALDHALASRALSLRITAIVEWHINADEPPLIDYNLDFDRDAGLFDDATPFRASDHDPVIVGLDP